MRVATRNALSISWVTMMLVALVWALRRDDEFVDDRTRHRVQPGGGFVKEDQLRLQHERAGQADAFFHAAAQFGGHLLS